MVELKWNNTSTCKKLPLVIWVTVTLLFTGCDILEVNNPNDLAEEELGDPAAVQSMVNGSEASVTRAIGAYLAPYSTATDELTWVGSRDAWGRLNQGDLDDPLNEFSDLAYTYVSEARWWSDEVINRIEEFRDNGELRAGDEVQLARAYLYGAIIQITIADMFDDFVFSENSSDPQPPIESENMEGLYDTAIGYINDGLSISGIGDELRATLLGLRARAKYSKEVWAKVNPAGQVDTDSPLVSNDEAAADAEAALDLMSGDFKEKLVLTPDASDLVVGDLSLALQVNSRLEMRVSDAYVIPSEDNNQIANIGDGDPSTSISIQDPVDEIADPVLNDILVDFVSSGQYADITAVSQREMYLILAENALANSNETEFQSHINDLRALDSELSEYDAANPNHPEALELLKHSRRVNLFFQGRRLADHYRFDDPAFEWLNSSPAVQTPGTFFPIAITEVRANPNL